MVCAPDQCQGCGGGLAGAPVVGSHHRQVFEAPPPRPVATEYQVQARRCPVWGVTTIGQAPG